jgi:hypothetical protein
VGIFSSRDWALESSVPGHGAVVEAGQQDNRKLDLGLLIAAMTGFLFDQQLRGSGFLTLTSRATADPFVPVNEAPLRAALCHDARRSKHLGTFSGFHLSFSTGLLNSLDASSA